ncbi:Protein mpe1 [Microbotryomycetes sp. JL221]|nr:Protein mpe1 [Microbotryomycetes sp. JL221]
MSSFVFYRFKSQKEPSRISFDGTGISVWDLKKEIIQENKMGKGTDFDFAIYNADTEEEYTEDHQIVPRSTSVLARRLPPSKPGRGNAQKYMPSMEGAGGPSSGGYHQQQQPGGKTWNAGQFSKRFDGKDDNHGQPGSAPQAPVDVKLPAAAGQDEASALAAMFAATSQQWQQTQEQMAQATPVYRAPQGGSRPGAPRPPGAGSPTQPGQSQQQQTIVGAPPNPNVFIPGHTTNASNAAASRYNQDRQSFRYSEHKPPPPGYICYRCGQKGHWIQECPTNNDKTYDDRPRIKRTTGIPKSFLQVVEGPDAAAAHDEKQSGTSGIMVTAEGGFVVAKPDSASWLAHRALTKNLSAKDVQDLAPTDPDLTCPICSKLLRDAVLTPCCSTSFCQDCIQNSLIDNDKLCPECETRIKNFDKLKIDQDRRDRVKKYIDDVVEASRDVAHENDDGDVNGVKAEGQDSKPKDEEAEAKQADQDSKDVKTEENNGNSGPPVAGQHQQQQQGLGNGPHQQPLHQQGPLKPPMTPQAFAAQQLAQQQQQMIHLMIQQAGGPQRMLAQLQHQTMNLQMTLSTNPGLPPPVRVQMMAQIQMCQQQYFVVQNLLQQQMMAAQQQRGGPVPQGPMGMQQQQGGPGNMSPQQQQQLQQQHRPTTASPNHNRNGATPQPTGDASATVAGGVKRQREEEEDAVESTKKAAIVA